MRAASSILFAMWLGLSSCSSTKPSVSPYVAQEPEERQTVRAERLTREAADLIVDRPERAEQILRKALAADLFHGPAHNNLGVVFLNQGKLYEAANEFEWARKLMPGHPDPRFNLAMTLEQAGQVDDALASYTAALEVYDGFLPAIQGLASLTLRSRREDERMRGWLEDIALRGEGAWREWAYLQLTKMR